MQRLRVLRGKFRGRSIPAPPAAHGNSHLTLGLVKEALFQILEQRLGSELPETSFFDLCAGSGQMAVEASSVGFASVHLCEVDSGRLRHLAEMVQKGGFPIEVHRRDFRRMAGPMLRARRIVAFLDPPYSFWDREGRSEAVDRLVYNLLHAAESSAEWLWFIVHGPAPYRPPLLSGPTLSIRSQETRSYRKQQLTFLWLTPADMASRSVPLPEVAQRSATPASDDLAET
ncbi:MAG: RsmD family RNA methyltransferase [Leptospirales bacterium]|nr:RsmD family RNA methyltransferase [Leptospirales bacterium]